MARSLNNSAETTRRYNNADVIDAFRAGTAFDGMQNRTGTLSVQESRNGDLNLVGYGWMLYAKYQVSTDEITAFTGHVDFAESVYQNVGTSTVRKHFNANRYGGQGGIEHIADSLSPASPQVGPVPDSVKDIGSWGKIRDYYDVKSVEGSDEVGGFDPLFGDVEMEQVSPEEVMEEENEEVAETLADLFG